jgi:PPP family 3-phenylpropionic acid transporter
MSVPYWRLSGFYGLYFALIGCIVPFWGIYLQHRSFNAADIGLLLALFSGVRIFAPNVWASLSYSLEHLITPLNLMRLGGGLMMLSFCAFYWATEFWHYAVIMVVYGFFWSAILPQYETLTLNHIKDNVSIYSNMLLWGSTGFIAVVTLLGWAFDYINIEYLPAIMLGIMILIVLNSMVLKSADPVIENSIIEKPVIEKPVIKKPVIKGTEVKKTKGKAIASNRAELAASKDNNRTLRIGLYSFLLINILLQMTHGPYYVFFTIHLQQFDYSTSMIGLLWSLGVFAEIILFWKISFFMHRWSLRDLVIASLLLTALRWLITAYFASNTALLIFAQCLHAFSFALLHVVSISYIGLFFPGKQRLRGQALYSGLGFGLGGAMGAYLAGITWESLGSQFVFVSAACIAFVAVLIAGYGLPRKNDLS